MLRVHDGRQVFSVFMLVFSVVGAVMFLTLVSSAFAQSACSPTPITCPAGEIQYYVASSAACPDGGFVCAPSTNPSAAQPLTPASKPQTISAVSAPQGRGTALSVGARGEAVASLQRALISLGYLAAGNDTGYFGLLTRDALRAFQCAKNIICTGDETSTGYGALGPKTKAALSASLPSTSITTPSTSAARTLSYGARGTDVLLLQYFLISKGLLAADAATGFFGRMTEAAVQTYQRANNLVSSGTPATTGFGAVGPKTRALIAAQGTLARATQPNSSAPQPVPTSAFSGGGGGGGGGSNSSTRSPSQASASTPTCTLSLSPASITAGATSTLAWSSVNAVGGTIDQGVGAVAASGSTQVNPTATTTYTASFTGTGGTSTCSATLAVSAPSIPSPSAPPIITSISTTTAEWGDTVTVTGQNFASQNTVRITQSSPNVAAAAIAFIRSIFAQNQTSIALSVPSPNGTSLSFSVPESLADGSYAIEIETSRGKSGRKSLGIRNYPPSCTLSASPRRITTGSSATLSWASSHKARTASLNQGIGTVPLVGTRAVSPTATTTYTLTVSNPTGSGTCSASVEVSAPATPDTTPPTVSFTSPANGATLSGAVALSATASDNVGVAAVEFRDNTTLLATDTASPFSHSWNTTAVQNGSHTLYAIARDAAGNRATSTVSVTVQNSVVQPPLPVLVKPSTAQITSTVQRFHTWTITNETDSSGFTTRNGLRRYIRRITDGPGTRSEHAAIQSTAACKSLEFLSEYARAFPDARDNAQLIAEFAAAIEKLQSSDTSRFFNGAVRSSATAGQYSAFGNAICGSAFLSAYKATGNPAYLDRASRIGDFLLRLYNPDPYYKATYGVAPLKHAPATHGIVDLVYDDERLLTTMTTWNVQVAPFLLALCDLQGAACKSETRVAAQAIAQFHSKGVLEGFDYFALKVPSHGKLVTQWNLGYDTASSPVRHNFADNAWHRSGDAGASNPTGTVGTDQIEYGIEALWRAGYDVGALRSRYQWYRDLPSPDFACLDAGISFAGYFRLGRATSPANQHYGSYYDIVGAGILLPFKSAVVPQDAVKTQRTIVGLPSLAALVDCDFRPVDPAAITEGTLPIASMGIGLIKTGLTQVPPHAPPPPSPRPPQPSQIPSCTLTARPASLKLGEKMRLHWETHNATSAVVRRIFNTGTGSLTITASPQLPNGNSLELSPPQSAATYTYEMTVTNQYGSATCVTRVPVGS